MNQDLAQTETTVAERLSSELERRMWALFNAAKVISERGDIATPDDWAAFHRAVSNIPESQHPRIQTTKRGPTAEEINARWKRHQYALKDCPICHGTGDKEVLGDFHRSGGIVPCDHFGWKEINNG